MSDISISVLMPVYNSEKFLEETVQAVINQSYTNWELILVDDGSTDNSKKLCDELRKKENRIKFIDKKNTGVSDTRNVALKNAKGQYVVLLGFKENPYKYVRASDLFICSSISEGFSLVIGEAMAIGIPVVSVDCPGPNEVLDFGKYGKLVNNNEDDLYNGIKEMLNNKILYEDYKNKAIERGKMFSIDKFINEVESVLDIN